MYRDIAREMRKGLAVLTVVAGSALQAQGVRGRIVLADSVTPGVGVVVTATAVDGKRATSAISSATGEYQIRLPGAGRYDLRILRIGYRPTLIAGIEIPAEGMAVRNLTLDAVPVSLAGISVREKADCNLRGRDAEIFLRLWEQARGALTAVRLQESSGSLQVHLARTEGRVDAMHYYAPERVGDPTAELDSATYRDWIASRLFASTAADTLLQQGYVRVMGNGSEVYDAPTAEVLLDDRFLDTHCMGVIRPPNDHRDWIGVAFSPRRTRDSVVDVSGVLWMDRTSAELRRLDFTYTNLRPQSYELCSVAQRNRPSVCGSFRESGANRFGLGGEATFVRLPGGEWLVNRLEVRTLSAEMASRPSTRKVVHLSASRECGATDRVVRQSPRAGDCVFIAWPVPRLTSVSTSVLQLWRNGAVVYRNDSSRAAMQPLARRQAGDRPGRLVGTVTNDLGQAVANAVIQIEQPVRRAAVTDSLGGFLVPLLPSGDVVVSVRCGGTQIARVVVAVSPDLERAANVLQVRGATQPKPTSTCSDL